MDDDLIRIVASAAAGLVIRVVGTAAWRQVRDRLAKVLGKGDHDRQQTVTAELDTAANQLNHAEPVGRSARAHELESELCDTFRARLRTDPELVPHLRALVAETQHTRRDTPPAVAVTVHGGTGVASGRDTTIGSITNTPAKPG